MTLFFSVANFFIGMFAIFALGEVTAFSAINLCVAMILMYFVGKDSKQLSEFFNRILKRFRKYLTAVQG